MTKFGRVRLEFTLPRSAAVLIGCYDISLGLMGNFKSKNESYQDYLKNIDLRTERETASIKTI